MNGSFPRRSRLGRMEHDGPRERLTWAATLGHAEWRRGLVVVEAMADGRRHAELLYE